MNGTGEEAASGGDSHEETSAERLEYNLVPTEDDFEESTCESEGATEVCGQGGWYTKSLMHSVTRSTLGRQGDH